MRESLLAKNGLCFVVIVLLHVLLCGNTLAKNSQDTISNVKANEEDTSVWVDPHDLSLNPEYINQLKRGEIPTSEDVPEQKSDVGKPIEQDSCQESETCKEQLEVPDTGSTGATIPKEKIEKYSFEMSHFKQLTQCVLNAFPTSGQKYVTMHMSEYQVKVLKQFLESNDKEDVHDAFKIVCDVFRHVKEGEKQCYSIWTSVFLSAGYNVEIIAIFIICLTMLVAILVVKRRLGISWFHQFMYLLSALFLVSLPWEWIRMYKQAFAEKQAAVIKEMPDYCQSGANLTIFRSFSRWVSNMVQWQNDECGKYHEAMLVDPVWEVSPSQAFANTVARFFTTPLKPIADDLGKSLNLFFQHIPVQWQPVIFLAVLLLLVLIVVSIAKLRLKLWLFEIGPSNARQPERLTEDDYMALENRLGEVVNRALQAHGTRLRPLKGPVEMEQKEEEGSLFYPIPDTQPIQDLKTWF